MKPEIPIQPPKVKSNRLSPNPVDLNGALNEMEGAYLREYEAMTEMHMGAFLIVGSALKEIRDQKLYWGTHDTFEIDVEKRFYFKKSQAYRLITAHDEAKNVPHWGDVFRKRHLREMKRLSGEKRTVARKVEEGSHCQCAKSHDVKIAAVKAVVKKYLEVQYPDRTRCAEAKRLLLGYSITNPTLYYAENNLFELFHVIVYIAVLMMNLGRARWLQC